MNVVGNPLQELANWPGKSPTDGGRIKGQYSLW